MLIDTLYSLEHFHGIAILVGRLDKSLDIFRETRTTITAAGIEELTTDTGI